MISNPIHKVLSIFLSCGVRALLMGGQACVFYGGAEFSRNTDFAILADEANLERLKQAHAKNWKLKPDDYRIKRPASAQPCNR